MTFFFFFHRRLILILRLFFLFFLFLFSSSFLQYFLDSCRKSGRLTWVSTAAAEQRY